MDDSSSSSYGRNAGVMNGRGLYPANRAYDFSRTSKSSKGGSLFHNREMERKKRVMKYKWYAVEGKIKASLKNGFRLFKRKCSQIIHGF